MANKKLRVGASELKLPAKNSKDDKKKWPGKKGGKKNEQQVVETPEAAIEATPESLPETPIQEAPSLEASPAEALVDEPSTEAAVAEPQPDDQPSDTPTEEHTPAEPPCPPTPLPPKKATSSRSKLTSSPRSSA